jgi:hypothetical protein
MQICSLGFGVVVITNELLDLGIQNLIQALGINIATCFVGMLFVRGQLKRCQ